MRIAVILGTRPEAIKLVPLVRAARAHGWDVRVWWSGQHDDMVQDVLSLFDVDEAARLDALNSCNSISQIFAYVLEHIDQLLIDWQPDLVWVQGDTTTAAAGALAAFHRQVPVGHVEAGLRTYDLRAPFPEEANRQIITRVAAFHYAPTERAGEMLVKEHVDPTTISVTGNTGIDALLMGVVLSRQLLPTASDIAKQVLADALVPRDLPRDLTAAPLFLVTTHRRENHGARLRSIVEAIDKVARDRPDSTFVYPVHPNPIVLNSVVDALSRTDNVLLTKPLQYPTLCALIDACSLVITDSGGLQEEAVSLGVPVVVLRSTTERPEGVEIGRAMLGGSEQATIRAAIDAMLARGRSEPVSVYGDGHACKRIIEFTERSSR